MFLLNKITTKSLIVLFFIGALIVLIGVLLRILHMNFSTLLMGIGMVCEFFIVLLLIAKLLLRKA